MKERGSQLLSICLSPPPTHAKSQHTDTASFCALVRCARRCSLFCCCFKSFLSFFLAFGFFSDGLGDLGRSCEEAGWVCVPVLVVLVVCADVLCVSIAGTGPNKGCVCTQNQTKRVSTV